MVIRIYVFPTFRKERDDELSDPEGAGRRAANLGAVGRGNGSGGRIRTYDQAINSRPLYH